jgi:hypothetical protein
MLLDWARGLEKQRGPSGKNPGPKYIRKITATVRAVFKEAVRRHLIERTRASGRTLTSRSSRPTPA